MHWKEFELKVLYISKKLNVPMLELLQWKIADIIKAMELMDV